MNKKNTPHRRRITDPQFSQPSAFIAATGYGNAIFHLDTRGVSLHVCSNANRNSRMIEEVKG